MRVLALSGGTRWGQDAVQCVVADSTLLKAAARGQVEAALAICALVGAKSNGSSSSSDSAMDTTVNILTVCDSAGCAPAALAAENGHWLLAWMLVRKAAAPLLTEDDDSSTTTSALAKAVDFGDRIHQLVQKHRQAQKDVGPRGCHFDDAFDVDEVEGDDEEEDVAAVDDGNNASDVGADCAMREKLDLLMLLAGGESAEPVDAATVRSMAQQFEKLAAKKIHLKQSPSSSSSSSSSLSSSSSSSSSSSVNMKSHAAARIAKKLSRFSSALDPLPQPSRPSFTSGKPQPVVRQVRAQQQQQRKQKRMSSLFAASKR